MHIPERLLMGPGPGTVPSRVLRAMAAPPLGHLDPRFLEILDSTCAKLRKVFETSNELTFPLSATGTGGMECVVNNLLEPGEEAIVCVNGAFGQRMAEVMERAGVTVHRVEVPWGESFPLDTLADTIARHRKAKALGIVHAETSTGAHQPLDGLGDLLHDAGMLFIVDAVTSLGGQALKVDEWGIDAVYAATQKCLSCPPGLSPVSFSPLALEMIRMRKTPVRSWSLDVTLLKDYLRGHPGRTDHHTVPVNLVYALHEALVMVLEEGLEARHARHQRLHRRLRAGLESMGLRYVPEHTLQTLNCIRVPAGADDAAVRAKLLDDYSIEIGGGLGPFAGKVWRIGLMGHAATQANVDLLLAALVDCLE